VSACRRVGVSAIKGEMLPKGMHREVANVRKGRERVT